MAIATQIRQLRVPAVQTASITLSLTRASASVDRSTTFDLAGSVARSNFAGTIALAVTGLPSGVTGSFAPTSLTDPLTDFVLTLTVGSGATLGLATLTITASGSGVADSALPFALTVNAVGAGFRYFGPQDAEFPRGITSDFDVLFEPTTQALSTVGQGSKYLWDWEAERVGAARWAAIPGGKRLTVTGSGSTAWTNFLSAFTTFVAGTGDYEILVPADMTMSGNGSDAWVVPTVADPTRRVYITFNGTLPTANVMPSLAQLAACSVWNNNTARQESQIAILSPSCPKITFTGIVLKCNSTIQYSAVVKMRNSSATSLATHPNGYVFDRFHIDTDTGSTSAAMGVKRGFMMNAWGNAILESWVTGLYGNVEVQAFVGYSGTKFNVLRNVYLEAKSIGFLLGGGGPDVIDGTCDPSDNLLINVACAKKTSWMSPAAVAGLKNGFESKDTSRLFLFNCVTVRSANTGQPYAMIFQNLQDSGNLNSAYNRNDDIIVINHDFLECQNGINLLSRIKYGTGVMPINPSHRFAFDNLRFRSLGENWGAPGYTGTSFNITGDIKEFYANRIGWTMDSGKRPLIRVEATIVAGSDAQNWLLHNFAGDNAGFFKSGGLTGLPALVACCPTGSDWAGNAFYGSPQYGGAVTPGATVYASAAAMGFDTTTGALGAPGDDDGIGGSKPGPDKAILDTLVSNLSWAYSR